MKYVKKYTSSYMVSKPCEHRQWALAINTTPSDATCLVILSNQMTDKRFLATTSMSKSSNTDYPLRWHQWQSQQIMHILDDGWWTITSTDDDEHDSTIDKCDAQTDDQWRLTDDWCLAKIDAWVSLRLARISLLFGCTGEVSDGGTLALMTTLHDWFLQDKFCRFLTLNDCYDIHHTYIVVSCWAYGYTVMVWIDAFVTVGER